MNHEDQSHLSHLNPGQPPVPSVRIFVLLLLSVLTVVATLALTCNRATGAPVLPPRKDRPPVGSWVLRWDHKTYFLGLDPNGGSCWVLMYQGTDGSLSPYEYRHRSGKWVWDRKTRTLTVTDPHTNAYLPPDVWQVAFDPVTHWSGTGRCLAVYPPGAYTCPVTMTRATPDVLSKLTTRGSL